jgi:ABC-type sugar transport system substrate-binding protein
MRKTIRSALLGASALVWAGAVLAQDAERPDIGVIVPTLDAQFWNSYVEFMEKGAEELGVNLTVLNADNKPDQMIKSLEDLVAQGVDGIIYTPYWATAVPGLTLANNAGIPVILTDTYADFPPQSEQFPNYIAFIGPSTARLAPDGRGALCRHRACRGRQEVHRRGERHRGNLGSHRSSRWAAGCARRQS